MGIAIREATTADLEWINTDKEEWGAKVQEHHEHGGGHSLEKAWAVLVAEDERGERLGWMYVDTGMDPSTIVPHLLYVEPDHRLRGVARALMEYVFARHEGDIELAGWDPKLFDAWISLGFDYEPAADDRPYDLRGRMMRRARRPD
ncbi:GNAT family N-acetyltransferase [Actinomadura atramentaria]|uniref:GNAT family N-acetyltransferase n=1 Tax=Actinomadura atramentaria TaxID=1990 RepID=UPI000379815C|nr:GNAT family N-acetyltransferase [Actinomadura atramentaria]